jgi:hypothetical protein
VSGGWAGRRLVLFAMVLFVPGAGGGGAAELWGRRGASGRRKGRVGLCGLCALPFSGRTLSLSAPRAERSETRATASRSPSLKLCQPRVRFQKNVYASAIGLCKDSMMMQSRKPSNADFWRSLSM